jgi:hypothetical protein
MKREKMYKYLILFLFFIFIGCGGMMFERSGYVDDRVSAEEPDYQKYEYQYEYKYEIF